MGLTFPSFPVHDAAGHRRVLVHLRGMLRRAFARLFGDAPRQAATGAEVGEAAVLRFPVRGEALLARLADRLRDRLAWDAVSGDPFLLTLSRGARPRLSIDRAAYVEYRTERATFHLIVDAAPDSRVTLETTDFDTVEKFIIEYFERGCCVQEPVEAAT